VACDKCEVWQHVACLNLSPGTENKEFICERCLYREEHPVSLPPAEGAQSTSINPKITIKLKLPTVHYEDSPIRVVPSPRTKSDILPLSPRRSPNTKAVREQLSSNKLDAPPLNLAVSNGYPPLQPQAHESPATGGVNQANRGIDAPPPQDSESPPPSANQAAPKSTEILPPQQASKAKKLGEAGIREDVQPSKSPPLTNPLVQAQTQSPNNTDPMDR